MRGGARDRCQQLSFQLTHSLSDTKGPLSKLTCSTIREANEAFRSVSTKQSVKRGSYAKFTPKQQAEVAKYASMHGITAAQCRYSKEFGTDLKESTVRCVPGIRSTWRR